MRMLQLLTLVKGVAALRDRAFKCSLELQVPNPSKEICERCYGQRLRTAERAKSGLAHTEISDEKIIAAIKKLSVNGSLGHDGMSPLLLKKNMPYLV